MQNAWDSSKVPETCCKNSSSAEHSFKPQTKGKYNIKMRLQFEEEACGLDKYGSRHEFVRAVAKGK